LSGSDAVHSSSGAQSEREHIASLVHFAQETVRFFAGSFKPVRERAVVRAFLRTLDIAHSDDEIVSCRDEPVDVRFRGLEIQVTDDLGGRHRHSDWKQLADRWSKARYARDLKQAYSPSEEMSIAELVAVVECNALRKRAAYGSLARKIDLIVYVSHTGRHLHPRILSTGVSQGFATEGAQWRSVSFLMEPFAGVLSTSDAAPGWLATRRSQVRRWLPADGPFAE
jgi:hypothetical protein